jgi:CRP/FNR family transcriptional regulator, cyclic AMP receptor protein
MLNHLPMTVQFVTARRCRRRHDPQMIRIGLTASGTVGPLFDPGLFVAKYGGAIGSRYAAKHALFSQGDAADCIFYFQNGQAQSRVISEEGKEAVIAVVKAGEFCGEGCLVGEPLRMSTVTTMKESLVTRLEKAAVIRAIHDDVAFAEFFVMYILNRTVRLTEDLVDHMFNSSEKRLARILLLLANYGKEGRVETVIANIDHQTLAQMVGTTRSRVNFFMNKFRKLGYIDYNGRISIHSSLLNVVLHDHPIDATEGPESPEVLKL